MYTPILRQEAPRDYNPDKMRQAAMEKVPLDALKKLDTLKLEHPIIAELFEDQYKTHTREKNPYHCCTKEKENGIPVDHITRTTMWAVAFATISGLPDHEIALAAIAAAGHDIEQGPGHEARSAEEVIRRMRKTEKYSDSDFETVKDAIGATALLGGIWQQPKPKTPAGVCVGRADLRVSLGDEFEPFVRDSLQVRWENARTNEAINKPDLSYNDPVAVEFWIKQLNFLAGLIRSDLEHDATSAVASYFFPHCATNLGILQSKVAQLQKKRDEQMSLQQLETFLLDGVSKKRGTGRLNQASLPN